jgi:hypothetical protein
MQKFGHSAEDNLFLDNREIPIESNSWKLNLG